MEFDYHDYKINILDTPGHQDFAEDTYRTLTAVDSVIIVVDGAKGVETQTRKLMEVCRMRNTPVIIFINKMDREAKDPFDLLDEPGRGTFHPCASFDMAHREWRALQRCLQYLRAQPESLPAFQAGGDGEGRSGYQYGRAGQSDRDPVGGQSCAANWN